jgi:DNA-binding response OmpR family regulator
MKKLLHVEDSEAMQKAVSLMLESQPIEAESVGNGKLALELTQTKHFDVIILDLDMPVMDGLTFLEAFKPVQHNTIVLVCSARHDVDSIYKAIELGASDYIMKPFTEDILFSKLRQLSML